MARPDLQTKLPPGFYQQRQPLNRHPHSGALPDRRGTTIVCDAAICGNGLLDRAGFHVPSEKHVADADRLVWTRPQLGVFCN